MPQPEHVDAVVVGSGFGGAVSACRLAEAGQDVVVLERGKPYPPGSFPRGPRGVAGNLWDPSEGLHGMFDVWSFEGLEALVSSGLGGGSLIYANVLIRKDPAWFVSDEHEHWPVGYAELEAHYERVERRLGATPYPLEHEPYATTPKTRAFRGAALDLGADWFLPDLAVTFAPAPGEAPVPGEPIRETRPNLHGRTRVTCRLVGECDIGCNAGAKNSLDFNYLTDAWHAGADIRTRCEVRAFEPGERGGWVVHYVEHDPAAEGSPTETGSLPRRTITADRLVLAAGTLGTTYLLLRNCAALPGLSPALGTHFSGNGDLLTFAVRCAERDGAGARKPRYVDPAFGPVITSAIRVPDAADGDGATGRGFYLEDAGVPEFATWLLQAADTPRVLSRLAPSVASRLVRRLLRRDHDTNLSSELAAAFGDCGLSSGVLPLLGMGRDVPDGRMRLDHGRLQVDWRKHGASAEYFDRVREFSREIAGRLGGEFLDNMLWRLNRVITVHALGGAPMGRSREEGVVDACGEVFGYPGLHIADGSVMPGPVGANPSLTIAALADHFADAILEGRTAPVASRRFARATAAPEPAEPAPPRAGAVGLAFTEQMKGYVAFGESECERGAERGERLGTRCMFELTIGTDDLDRFIDDPDHAASATGVVRCDALGGERPVLRGWFNLFVGGREKRMLYRLHLTDAEGHPVTLTGHKRVADDEGVDNVWADTSTLYTRLLAGHADEASEAEAPVLAAGVLRIQPLDFARQLLTFDTTPDHRPDAVARFGALFAGQLWEVYGPKATR